jgi:hypothetical protein
MSITVDWFVTDDGIVVEQVLEDESIDLEELLILPVTSNCDTEKIKKVNNAAADFLVPFYQGDILLAEDCLDIYLDVLAEIANIDPYWFFGLETRFVGFNS